MSSPRAWSLRKRLAIWSGIALTSTVAGLTMAAIAAEHQTVRALEAAAGESLVSHLAAMPELRATAAEARAQLSALVPALSATGATLELVQDPVTDGGVLAATAIDLVDGRYVLQYRAEPPWLARITRRAIALHVLHGAVALGLLLAGVEWIIRTRLTAPLGRIAHQVRFMGSGGGWSPKLPSADVELDDIVDALAGLGPALQRQIEQWIEGERRAAAAAVIAGLRATLREPHIRALALLGDLQARDYVSAEGKPRLRALIAEVEALTAAIRDLEGRTFGQAGTLPRAPG